MTTSNPASAHVRQDRRWLLAILALAALIRLLFVLVIDPRPSLGGGDVGWYLEKGRLLIQNVLDYPVQTPPVFLAYAGLIQILFPGDPVLVLRLLNIVWAGLLIGAVHTIGLRCLSPGVARLAALLIAIAPAFIIETGAPLTESLYLALIFAGLAVFIARGGRDWRGAALTGLLLALAALTRAVALAFPALLVIPLIRASGWRRGLRLAGVMLLAFGLLLSTWTVYNLLRWNRFIIAGEGLTAMAWMGVTGVTDPHEIDQQIGVNAAGEGRDAAFVEGFLNAFLRDLPRWLGNRAGSLLGAYLQPHNTVYYPGESLKDLALAWLRTDRSAGGLLALTQGDAFWPKLVLYVFHFWALIAGGLGMVIHARRGFWSAFALYAFLAYVTAVHFVIMAIPRYVFPVEPILYLFGAWLTLRIVRRGAAEAVGKDAK